MAAVSLTDLGGGRYRLRWRELVEEDGVRRLAARSRTVRTQKTAIVLQGQILARLDTEGSYEEPVRVVLGIGDFEQAGLQWLRHKAARGSAESSLIKYKGRLDRISDTVRALEKIPKKSVNPVTVLSRDFVGQLVLAWRAAELADGTVYERASTTFDVWQWAASEPDVYPQTPPLPPRSVVVPLPPKYSAGPAPTMAELDACIGHIRTISRVGRVVAVVMRFTGLRAAQVLAIERRDFDLSAATLRITSGKSRREKAEQRMVPVSRHLLEALDAFHEGGLAGLDPEASVVPRRKDQRAAVGRSHLPHKTIRNAWQAATDANECRLDVWKPRNRMVARPEHAFRAAFQAFLVEKGVRDSVVDFLVGHAPSSVRARHYAPASLSQLRAAVDLIPEMKLVHPLEHKHKGMLARLGQEPDAAIARRFGVSGSMVHRWRTSEGIAAFKS